MSIDERTDHPLVYALRSRDGNLADQAARLIRQSLRLLEFTLSTFSSGTDHTQRHTRTVEKIARMVLSDEFLSELRPDELFFLALSCHYHDLAMAGTEADDQTAEGRDQVRDEHAIRIGTIIRDKWAELGFENPRTAEVLGEVCRGHRPRKNSEGEANWDELHETELLGPGVAVRVRLLSALIYAIDELHLGADRAPERVQNWRSIQNDLARMHWRRHQAVNGPAPHAAASLLFQVTSDTPEFEENLRSQVFRKAFSAMRDLRKQAGTEGVKAAIPSVTVQWQRQTMWGLLIPVVCSDLKPRSQEEIAQAVLARFRQDTAEKVDLAPVCTESGNADQELSSSAARAVRDAVTKCHLVAHSSSGYILSDRSAHADDFFGRARHADDLDLLFVGRYRHSWEQELFASEFGRRYVRLSVFPAVERAYSVQLTQRPPTDPVRLLMELCPSAARMARENAPTPSNLMKNALLAQVALTGALIDLHSDPERLLELPIRGAVRALIGTNAGVAPTVRLLEELALLGGFTHEQLSSAGSLSDAAQAAIDERTPGSSVRIHMLQTLPSGAGGAAHLHRLMLASQRASTPIMLTAAGDHEFSLRVEGDSELANRETTGVVVGVSPGAARLPASFQMPARVEVSRSNRTVRLYLGRFSTNAPTAYPVIVTLPAPPAADRPRVTFASNVQWPELTVRDWRALESANQVVRNSAARIELIVEETDQLLGVMASPQGSFLFGLWPGPEIIQRALRGLDGAAPAPVRTVPDDVAQIAGLSQEERDARWQAARDYSSDPRRRVTSLFLRMALADGRPVEERFLRFFPFNFFPAPQFETDAGLGAEELRRQWNEGENDFLLTCFFHGDVYELARELRTWCQNPEGEFPFRFLSGGTPEPVTRSMLTVRLLRSRDRVYYRDRPIIFEFRPVNQAEAYQMEAGYWREMGDERRAQLAQEICDRAGPQSDPQPPQG